MTTKFIKGVTVVLSCMVVFSFIGLSYVIGYTNGLTNSIGNDDLSVDNNLPEQGTRIYVESGFPVITPDGQYHVNTPDNYYTEEGDHYINGVKQVTIDSLERDREKFQENYQKILNSLTY